jgi:hypothetical protein
MSTMKPTVTFVATLIGDLVGSRTSADRAALHQRLADVLAEANAALEPAVPLRITAGDEFQGGFATVGAALHASWWLRLALPDDLRHGIGWGEVSVLAEEPRVEDGPGWWAARAAIEAAELDASRPATRHVRTAYRRAEGVDGPDPRAINAALLCRDQMVGSASERSIRLLRGTLRGLTQAELATQEGISASAVSQRVRHDGLGVLIAADELLREV